MPKYKILNALSGIFLVLGVLGIIGTITSCVLAFNTARSADVIEVATQFLGMLFASLVLLGLAEIATAILELVQNSREQKEMVARIEIKLNNLSDSKPLPDNPTTLTKSGA